MNMIEYTGSGTGPERDSAPPPSTFKVEKGAMTQQNLVALIDDIRWQPDWRSESDMDCAYYDGFQISPEQRARAEATGQPIAVVNLMARAINTLLGQEAKTRSGWKITADTDAFRDVADALQPKLAEAQRETYADMAISNGYASEVKAGLGWVEVSRKADLFAECPYRVADVHRNEIWWDWRARELDLSDARWLVRQRWIDCDEAEVMFPDFKHVFSAYAGGGWGSWLLSNELDRVRPLAEAYEDFRRFQIQPDEWLDTGRKRIRFYEVWYRVKVGCVAMVAPGRKAVEFDKQSPLHQEAVRRGLVRLVNTHKTQMRCAIYAGPHRLSDRAVRQKRFPYIPFWGYRDDADRTPYGMARGMRYPQDEYNARRSKLMWLLQSVQVLADEDALATKFNDFRDLADEIHRPDALLILNAQRKNKDAIQIRRDIALPREQAEVMQDAKALVQEQPAVFGQMLGNAENVRSGIAINSLVEQGATAQGELNDNYRYGRRMVGEALLDLIVEDHQLPNMEVEVGLGASKRAVILNEVDIESGVIVRNKVADAPVKVGLEDIPNTPSYRLQQQQQIAAVLQVGGADPAVRAVLIPSFIESTDLPNREHDARVLRQMYGVPQPGDERAMEKREQQGAQEAAEAAEIQKQNAIAEVREKTAKADAAEANASLTRTKVAALNHTMAMDEMAGLSAREEAALRRQREKVELAQLPAANEDQIIDDVLAAAGA